MDTIPRAHMALQTAESREASRVVRLNAMRGGGNSSSRNRYSTRIDIEQPAPIVPQGTSQGTVLTDPSIATGSRAVPLTQQQIANKQRNADFWWSQLTGGITYLMEQHNTNQNIVGVRRQLNDLEQEFRREFSERGIFTLQRSAYYRDQIRRLSDSLIP